MKQKNRKRNETMQASHLVSRFGSRCFVQVFARLIVLGLLFPLSTNILAELPPLQATVSADSDTANSWRFRVWLDDRIIGYHNFFLAKTGELVQLHSEASFEYKLLFVKLYDYEHENRETWNGDCLMSIDSRTDANGQPYAVNGRRKDGEFELNSSSGASSLPECVMSFAYWNPSFLEQKRLLNTQNGEFQEIKVSPPVFEELEVQGEQRPTNRYRLAAGALNLDLWYSTDNQWLALESETEGGRTLRYELL